MAILPRVLFLALGVLYCLFNFVPSVQASDNLLINPDLENFDNDSTDSGEENIPNFWFKNVSTLKVFATNSAEFVHTGTRSALLKSTSSSTKYLYQVLPASPGATYRFSGWTKLTFGSGSAYLRVTQCNTLDCKSGKEEIGSTDSSNWLSNNWGNLSLTFTASTLAAGLKLKTSSAPESASPSGLIWDSLELTKILPLTIDFSPPATVSADVPFSVPVTITNASPSARYFVKALGGAAGSSLGELRSTSTFNGTNWQSWNGSWQDMPQLSIGETGSGSADLSVRFNSQTSSSGASQLLIRTRLFESEDNIDSLTKSLDLVIVPSPEASRSSKEQASASAALKPDIRLSFSQTTLDSTVAAVSITATNLQASTSYFLKVRLRQGAGFTHGQTINNNLWLSDNDAWSKFPMITADAQGRFEGNIQFRLKEGEESGDYQIMVRLHQKDTNDNFDSEIKTVTFKIEEILGVATPSALPFILSNSPVLGTMSALPLWDLPADHPTFLAESRQLPNNNNDLSGTGLLSWGMMTTGAALLLRAREV